MCISKSKTQIVRPTNLPKLGLFLCFLVFAWGMIGSDETQADECNAGAAVGFGVFSKDAYECETDTNNLRTCHSAKARNAGYWYFGSICQLNNNVYWRGDREDYDFKVDGYWIKPTQEKDGVQCFTATRKNAVNYRTYQLCDFGRKTLFDQASVAGFIGKMGSFGSSSLVQADVVQDSEAASVLQEAASMAQGGQAANVASSSEDIIRCERQGAMPLFGNITGTKGTITAVQQETLFRENFPQRVKFSIEDLRLDKDGRVVTTTLFRKDGVNASSIPPSIDKVKWAWFGDNTLKSKVRISFWGQHNLEAQYTCDLGTDELVLALNDFCDKNRKDCTYTESSFSSSGPVIASSDVGSQSESKKSLTPDPVLASNNRMTCERKDVSFLKNRINNPAKIYEYFPENLELDVEDFTLDGRDRLEIAWPQRKQKDSLFDPKTVDFRLLKNGKLIATDGGVKFWSGYRASYQCDGNFETVYQFASSKQTGVTPTQVASTNKQSDAAPTEVAAAPEITPDVAKALEEIQRELEALKLAQQEQQEALSSDAQAPVITILSAETRGKQGIIKGRVEDNVGVAEITIERQSVAFDSSGFFEWRTFVPAKGKQLIIEATDLSGLSGSQTLQLARSAAKEAVALRFDNLNPLSRKVGANSNALALIVGVAEYKETPAKAVYADSDAQMFAEYATEKLGIPESRVKTLLNHNADETGVYLAVQEWLFRAVEAGESDVYVFFAGHGLASDDGEEMYLLPFDGSPRLLARTALLRDELFNDIAAANPRSVTVFLDTCYSGTTRGTDMLIASRPIAIRAKEQAIPPNFTVMTAAAGDQTAKPLEEAKHGMFSYFLMKGMEGDADANQDNQITAGELHAYVQQNVIQQSSGSQTPELQGDANRVLVRFQ